jgi:hypothetical protein
MKWIGKHPVFSDLMIGSVLLTPPDNQYEYELTLPNDDGSAGQVLTTDGNGLLTWTTAAGSGVTMTNGANNRVMTATGTAAITGETDFTFDDSIKKLFVGAIHMRGPGSNNVFGYNGATFASYLEMPSAEAFGDVSVGSAIKVTDGSGSVEAADLMIEGGNAAGTNMRGGIMRFNLGTHTGSGTPGSFLFKGSGATEIAKIYDTGLRLPIADQAIVFEGGSHDTTFKAQTTAGAARTITLPDATGTVALTSDIPAAYTLPLATTSVRGGVELGSDTDLTETYETGGTGTASRTYPVQLNAADQMGVSVPWTDTTYTLPQATATARGGVELFSNTVQSVAGTAVSATASRTYGVQLNGDDQMVVNVPWTDTDTKVTLTGTTVGGLATYASTDNLTINAFGTFSFSPITSTLKLMSPQDTGDLLTIDVTTHGATTFTTTDDNATAADLTFTPDGDVIFNILDADPDSLFKIGVVGGTNHFLEVAGESGNYSKLTMYEEGGSSTDDYFQIDVQEHGATILKAEDASGGQASTLTLDTDGLMILDAGRNGLIQFKDDGVLYGHLTSASSLSNFTLFEAAGASSADYFKIDVDTHGATTIATHDTAGHQADLTLDVDGTITIDSTDGIIDFDDDTASMAKIQNELGNVLTLFGNTLGSGKVRLREDTDNGTNDVTIQAPSDISSDKAQALQDASGTIALTTDIPDETVSTGSFISKQVKVVLSQSDCNSLNTTPVELIPAQGANTIIVPAGGILMVDRGGAQNNSAADLNFHYADKEPGTYGQTALFHIRRFMVWKFN